VFENVLGQGASNQLALDIKAGALAPAMLFSGPPSSGKGTAALELGRVISCEAVEAPDSVFGRAAWDCSCSSCSRHRFLLHPDLLCLGSRPFYAEITASGETLLRDGSSAARILFIRSVRKLLLRFNPVLWEDDPAAGKISPLVNSLAEKLEEFDFINREKQNAAEQNPALIKKISKDAVTLESQGISGTIRIDQLRRAAWWSRHAPFGRGKLLLIENADRILEEARNSLLKILEEPPGRVSILLTTSRPGTLPSTVLSRLRVYRFGARSREAEAEVLRRVFRSDTKDLGINGYLDSFLPVSCGALEEAAAFFAASAAYKAVMLSKKQGRPLPEEAVLLGKFCAPKAEAAGFGRPREDTLRVTELVLEKAGKFEIRSLFSRFISILLELVSESLRQPPAKTPVLAYNELWKKSAGWAHNAVSVYNLRPGPVLEKIFTDLSREMAEL
jgi:DNA polymerase-3 subunit gamma/tau